ncbi:NAD(P)/FAD-dependent oxidoreductase [Flavobacterium humi]|uniref:NAD(P)/FAD-dependent oxidoreductase n=1 Tax=Flavobacterium humi TaxID=2562683 RepID=UPI001FE614CF|nr:NAD(P)/FAD-dependent oxidoreductase [Flavobacterium humi]
MNFQELFVTGGWLFFYGLTYNSNLAGGIVNIDGITGGFDFQNAWTSGFIVVNSVTGE